MLIEQLPTLQIITIKNLAMNVSLLQPKSTIMKYIGILNFINHIVCMILCAIVIVLAIQNNSVFYFLCQHSCNASVIVEHHGVHRKTDRCTVQIGSIVGTIHPDNAISVFIPSYNNNKEFGIVVMHRLFVLAIRPSLILMPVPKEHVTLLWQLKPKMRLLPLLLS